ARPWGTRICTALCNRPGSCASRLCSPPPTMPGRSIACWSAREPWCALSRPPPSSAPPFPRTSSSSWPTAPSTAAASSCSGTFSWTPRPSRHIAAETVTPAPPVCVFDLDHTLVNSPLDLKAVGREMEAFMRERGLALPPRELRWSGAEIFGHVRVHAPHLEAEILAIPQAHERRAMEQAALEPFAAEALDALRQLGFATAIWTNNDRVVANFVLDRFNLLPYLDLVVTRDDVTALKPDTDALRVLREQRSSRGELRPR